MLTLQNLTKMFPQGKKQLHVLKDVSLEVPAGGKCALVGPSGSGKSTLLGICAGLDRPTTGKVLIDGVELTALNEDKVTDFRGSNIGFVFQSFHLIPTLTALENVMVPAELRGVHDARARAEKLLDRLGLAGRFTHYPSQLSGGEQQRTAIARAYINSPKLIFADEPTGNLDSDNARQIEELMLQFNREEQTTLVLATHNPVLADKMDFVIELAGGKIKKVVRGKGALA